MLFLWYCKGAGNHCKVEIYYLPCVLYSVLNIIDTLIEEDRLKVEKTRWVLKSETLCEGLIDNPLL